MSGSEARFDTRHMADATGPSEGLTVSDLRVERLDFLLRASEWQAPPGSLIGLVGANGAGKTTFLSAIAGVLPAQSGRVEVASIPTTEFGFELPSVVGLVSDRSTALESQTLSAQLRFLESLFRALDFTYATDLAVRLQVPLEKPLRSLSRGTRMKAAFIMVEASRPKVLLLDEPTAGLDPHVRLELLEVLGGLMHGGSGRIVVFSTHILEDIVDIATAVSLVRRGEVLPPQGEQLDSPWRVCAASERLRSLSELFDVSSFA